MTFHNSTDLNMNVVPGSLESINKDSDHDGITDNVDKSPFSCDIGNNYNSSDCTYSNDVDTSNNSIDNYNSGNDNTNSFDLNNDNFNQGSGDYGNVDTGSSHSFNNGNFD